MNVGHVRDSRAALSDPGCLDDDDIDTGCLGQRDGGFHARGELDARLSSGQRADEAAVMPRAVHADAVAEEGASRALAGWVDTDDGHALVGSVEEESAEELLVIFQ